MKSNLRAQQTRLPLERISVILTDRNHDPLVPAAAVRRDERPNSETRWRLLLVLCLVWIGVFAPRSAYAAPAFRMTADMGPYDVGLRIVQQYDMTRAYRGAIDALGRSYLGERARPLQTLIWYPAAKTTAKPMTVKDYVDLLPTETNFDHAVMWSQWKDFVSGVGPTFNTEMRAVKNAAPQGGRYPVVIYSPSLNSMSWENADLCEYLASHGYVVIATPNFGATSRSLSVEDILGAKADATQGVEANAADIEFLIGYAHSLPYADTSRIAVAGFSWGGMANLLAAARDGRIRAMVELDTSFRYFPGLVESFADVHADQITIPMLYISHAEESQESIARRSMPSQIGPSVLNEWTHGDLVYVNMRALIHGEFSSMFQRNEFFWKNNYEPHKIPDYTREDGTVGYGWIARYVLEFLNSSICLDAKATDFLGRSPIENGAPANFMAVTYRKAVGNEPSMDSLRAEVGRQGFSDASEVYARMKKDAPGFAPRSSELVDWADELSALGRIAGSIEVRKLNIEVNPNAQGVYAALGDAYAQAGQQDLAAEYYRRQLQKTPRDLATQEKLARSVH